MASRSARTQVSQSRMRMNRWRRRAHGPDFLFSLQLSSRAFAQPLFQSALTGGAGALLQCRRGTTGREVVLTNTRERRMVVEAIGKPHGSIGASLGCGWQRFDGGSTRRKTPALVAFRALPRRLPCYGGLLRHGRQGSGRQRRTSVGSIRGLHLTSGPFALAAKGPYRHGCDQRGRTAMRFLLALDWR